MACARDNTELATDESTIAGKVDWETTARDVAESIGFDSVKDASV